MSIASNAFADTVYIRDTLYVPLRGGESSEHRILHRGLKSGTALERLEINDDTGYSRVRTNSGIEGWLQTQYLVEEPVASTQLDSISEQLETLQAQHQQTLLQLHESRDSQDEISETRDTLTAEKENLSQQLQRLKELSANVISIDEENKQMSANQKVLLQQIDELNADNDALSSDRAQDWFLRGAGTLLTGLLLGFWIARRIYRSRNTGGWA